jgi:pimeloyl-ACP methyl ester carboxylesterase
MNSGEYWFAARDGLRLFSRVYAGPVASAPDVLCLHGLLRNSRDFEDLAPRLAERYRVIVPDVRGRGFSARDPDPTHYQIPVYLQDLEPLLGALGMEHMAVIGTSMGGLMAMVLAASRPGLVTRIVLNDVGPEVDPAGLERIRGYAGRAPTAGSWSDAAAQLRVTFGAAWPDLEPARWEKLARRSYRENESGMIVPDADSGIGDVVRTSPSAAPDLWPLWKALVGTPVLALRGAHSDILSEETLARMQREKAELKAITVPQRGHAPLLDEPECLSAIDDFLAAV